MTAEWTALFLAPGGAEPTSELEAELSLALARAHKAWPSIQVPDPRFLRELALRVRPDEDPVAALRATCVEDLYLAVAWACGDATALAQFDATFAGELRSNLGRAGLSPSEADETLQVMREELFVSQRDAGPRILNYKGRGKLKGWLRAVAGRTGWRVAGRSPRQVELTESVVSGRRDPELEVIKRTYGKVFQEALDEALAQASTDDRLLLTRRFRQGLSCEAIGAICGLHRATVSRNLADARARLIDATRTAVSRKLRLGRAEFASVMRLIQSDLDVALSGIAAPDGHRATST